MNDRWEERLQRYLDGAMDRAERAEFEREVTASDDGLSAVYDELAVRAALEERRAGRSAPRVRARRRRARWIPAVVAAAAIVLFAVVLQESEDPEPVFRSGAEGGPRAVEPMGFVESAPDSFVWTSRPGAMSYRFELFDAAGKETFSETTSDTFLVLPPGDVRSRGAWKSTALDDLGIGEASTGRIEFWTGD